MTTLKNASARAATLNAAQTNVPPTATEQACATQCIRLLNKIERAKSAHSLLSVVLELNDLRCCRVYSERRNSFTKHKAWGVTNQNTLPGSLKNPLFTELHRVRSATKKKTYTGNGIQNIMYSGGVAGALNMLEHIGIEDATYAKSPWSPCSHLRFSFPSAGVGAGADEAALASAKISLNTLVATLHFDLIEASVKLERTASAKAAAARA